jgi:hypothetical protein
MARKAKFTTRLSAGRNYDRMGWGDLSDDKLIEQMNRQMPWRGADSANLARIANAMEKLTEHLTRKKLR